MDDLISRQAVLDINEHHHGQMPNHVNHEIWKEIKALPSITPKEKTGHWKRNETIRLTYCSECGFGQHIEEYRAYNYCPNCGARMVEPQESERV